MKNDLRELAKGLYDADISMLDIRISQLEKENNKLKSVTSKMTKIIIFREIVSLREENRQMRAKLAERERAKEAENKD